MQILTMSDEVVPAIYSLNIKQRFQGVDLILSCGDLPIYYVDFVITMLGVPCFYVWGNHDGPEIQADGQTLYEVRGGTCLEDRSVLHNGILIAGLGGSLRYKEEGRHQYTDSEMMRRAWRLVPQLLINRLRYGRYLDMLITHAPPLGIHNGPDYPHHGFRAFLWLMDRFCPRYLIHGHIHLSYGYDITIQSTYRSTMVLNTAGYRMLKVEPEECREWFIAEQGKQRKLPES
ncbi:MAG: metallophosphoesterase [Oscillochloris sp.]|nr:metallophosphoesterase [Oscillochloris sp.]